MRRARQRGAVCTARLQPMAPTAPTAPMASNGNEAEASDSSAEDLQAKDDRPDALAEHEARGDDEHLPSVRASVVAPPRELRDRAEHARQREVGREIHADADGHAGGSSCRASWSLLPTVRARTRAREREGDAAAASTAYERLLGGSAPRPSFISIAMSFHTLATGAANWGDGTPHARSYSWNAPTVTKTDHVAPMSWP